MRSRWASVASLAVAAATICSGKAAAHALFEEPAPRDQRDGYKDGSPCGVGFDPSQPATKYAPGQTINVRWLETVDHSGCFLVELSAGGDQDFQILGRKSHSNPPSPEATSAEPRRWNMDVTLPASECLGCTLRLRQLMLDADVIADACTAVGAPVGSIYTTCANVTLANGGPASSPDPAPDGGCSVRPPRGNVLVFAAALLAATILRRLLTRRRGAPAVASS
jgi:hypothetical protein